MHGKSVRLDKTDAQNILIHFDNSLCRILPNIFSFTLLVLSGTKMMIGCNDDHLFFVDFKDLLIFHQSQENPLICGDDLVSSDEEIDTYSLLCSESEGKITEIHFDMINPPQGMVEK
jgi:hypothetical protein